jgi:hypothetical protein
MAVYESEYNGKIVQWPSVTTILGILDKHALINWGINCALNHVRDNRHRLEGHGLENVLEEARTAHKDTSKDATDIGSLVHDAIEAYLKGDTDPADSLHYSGPEEAVNCVNAFVSWYNDNEVKPIELEKKIINEEIGYGGRMDFLGYVNGKLTILDWKTSKAIYDEYRYQVGAYALAVPEVERIAALRLDKQTGEWALKDFSGRIEQSKTAFKLLTEVYYTLKKRKLTNNPHVERIWKGVR